MLDPWEDFFIEKIKAGLEKSSGSLSREEENILRTPAVDLHKGSIDPQDLKSLQSKCIEALRISYANDSAIKNKQPLAWWRQNNEMLYKYSQLILSAIVQEWYLTVGRSQEKKAAGCATLVAIIVIILGVVLIIMQA